MRLYSQPAVAQDRFPVLGSHLPQTIIKSVNSLSPEDMGNPAYNSVGFLA